MKYHNLVAHCEAEPVTLAGARLMAAPGGTAAKQAETKDRELKTGTAVIMAVKECPRTTAELQDRVCVIMGWEPRDVQARGRIYAAIKARVDSGTLVKRDDPKTQLPAFYLPDAFREGPQ